MVKIVKAEETALNMLILAEQTRVVEELMGLLPTNWVALGWPRASTQRAAMANLLNVCLLAFAILATFSVAQERRVYIVYMGAKPSNRLFDVNLHSTMLENVLQSSLVQEALIYSYKRSFNGFAANLTEGESKMIAGMDGVVSVFQSKMYKLHTTRSWDFVGLRETVKRRSGRESDVIIGVLDTGVWPESESFDDEGFGPPPRKWKGTCQTTDFTCNNKVIGARVYINTRDDSPRDFDGHGTHTASTAAGRAVKDASLYGIAKGTARGGVPSARIAVYKVCSAFGCADEDILAAFDDAIADGVDILSVSLGYDIPLQFSQDVLAIGAFHAMLHGILTSNSAGNSGPDLGTTTSLAPWILSVAASSTDRRLISKVVLGNGNAYEGTAINTFTLNGTQFPFMTGAEATKTCDKEIAMLCIEDCLDPETVKGKIVYCDGGGLGIGPKHAGAIGMVRMATPAPDVAFPYLLPATSVSDDVRQTLLSYINGTKNPEATILKSESVFDPEAPTVASFSSRGPNQLIPDILKPDISAPGVDILAAFSPAVSLSSSYEDERFVKYNIISGTSMACPHVTGAAAYVKTFHPHWSPSAIKSALITTATPMNAKEFDGAEFAYGSGNINPRKAIYPGLVYDATEPDYIQLLCDLGYTTLDVQTISGKNTNCSNYNNTRFGRDFNYPTMALKVDASRQFSSSFHRTVTNVARHGSTYEARIIYPTNSGIQVVVTPSTLKFNSKHKKQDFVVQVSGRGGEKGSIHSISLVWSDGKHEVRSPIVVYTASE